MDKIDWIIEQVLKVLFKIESLNMLDNDNSSNNNKMYLDLLNLCTSIWFIWSDESKK